VPFQIDGHADSKGGLGASGVRPFCPRTLSAAIFAREIKNNVFKNNDLADASAWHGACFASSADLIFN
jgi:hypothetical protein